MIFGLFETGYFFVIIGLEINLIEVMQTVSIFVIGTYTAGQSVNISSQCEGGFL